MFFGDNESRRGDGLARVGGIEREEPTERLLPGRGCTICREDEKGRREERKKTESGIGEVAAEREKPKGAAHQPPPNHPKRPKESAV